MTPIYAKGEVEVYYKGRKLVLRPQPGNGQHFVTKVPESAYNAGDAIVLRVTSPFVHRAIVVPTKRPLRSPASARPAA